ncbi:substrate-binding periplasmic protein [Silvanigrella sp.]|uniref:substrate-binding periplasmic protein n=1 Tax=Silvanigrella sp. TaxID=2024976 RepID=UPI0037CA3C43
MLFKFLIKIFIFIIFFFSLNVFSEEITLPADPSFTGEIEETQEKKLGGLGGEIIAKALKEKNIKMNLEWRPWTRAYKEALENRDHKTFIIPLTRIPEREEKFIWVSKIYDAHTLFLSMKGSKKINSILEAKSLKIGVLASSSYRAILARPENGLDQNNIDEIPIDIRNFKKLIGKRIDAWFTIDIVAIHAIKTLASLEKLSESDFNTGNSISIQSKYIGTTSKTSPELIKKVYNAVEYFKNSKEYQKIINQIPKRNINK